MPSTCLCRSDKTSVCIILQVNRLLSNRQQCNSVWKELFGKSQSLRLILSEVQRWQTQLCKGINEKGLRNKWHNRIYTQMRPVSKYQGRPVFKFSLNDLDFDFWSCWQLQAQTGQRGGWLNYLRVCSCSLCRCSWCTDSFNLRKALIRLAATSGTLPDWTNVHSV